MPLLTRNAIAFLIAVAIYAGGLRAAGYIFDLLHLQWGLGALLLFHCAFGIVGYFLFRGSSRAVLVFFASIIYIVAFNVVAPDRHDGWAQVFVSISFGVLAAITTNLTGWVVERIKNSRSGPTMEEVKETERLARRESTLAFRLGKWVGRRLHSSGGEK
jgi:hypothetical protein